jgi:HPt (histidine-containing phosphotransfer) domain-containing protein
LHSVYTRSARTLHESLGGLIDQLRNSIQCGDQHKTQSLVHTYKGTSATLGLVQLSSELARLENMLKGHAQILDVTTAIDSLHSTLSRARTELLGAIDSLTKNLENDSQPQADSDSMPHDSEKLKAALTALAVLLDKSDMNALDQYSELTKLVKPSSLSIIEPLELAIQNLDFEAAKNECSRLINEGHFL